VGLCFFTALLIVALFLNAHASFDTGPNTLAYNLPLGAAIAPHGYLVLFPAGYSGIRSIDIIDACERQSSFPFLPTTS
jgi:hypothetical protein